MTDHRKPDLLVPDRSIVSIDEAKKELAAKQNPTSSLKNFATREQVLRVVEACEQGIVEAALAVGAKVYDQIGEETAAHLEEMEALILQRVLAEVEARTLAGRAKALWRRFVAPPVTAPALVPEYDAELARLHAEATS